MLFLRIAARNLLANKRRTLLLGSAIAAVTMLLVILTSVSNGIQDTMLRAATTLSTGHVNVAGFYKITSGQAAPVVTDYEPLLEYVQTEIPEARFAVDRLRGWGRVVSRKNSLQLGLGGVDVTQEKDFYEVLNIVSGDLDGLKQPHTALIFEGQAEKLEVEVGDTLTISAPTVRGANNSMDVTVAAIAQDIGYISNFSIFTPKQTIRDIYLLGEHSTGAIQIYLDDYTKAGDVAERLRRALDEKGYRVMEPQSDPFWMKFPVVTREDWTGQKLDITTWEDEMAFLTWTLQAFDSLTFVMVAVLMIIILIGVMNSMWMTIRERTREIGTLRAIGMGRGRVLLMFVVETALLSIGATSIGAGLGIGLGVTLNALEVPLAEGFQIFLMRDTLRLVLDFGSVMTAIMVITATVTLFSLYPATRAARLKPVTAMHHVG
ncbi:MAG: putative ABC transport system permease protein [Myxococcota bacterium]|jgi:putative ABC transport system permease protein